jgi:hypothetical protein
VAVQSVPALPKNVTRMLLQADASSPECQPPFLSVAVAGLNIQEGSLREFLGDQARRTPRDLTRRRIRFAILLAGWLPSAHFGLAVRAVLGASRGEGKAYTALLAAC